MLILFAIVALMAFTGCTAPDSRAAGGYITYRHESRDPQTGRVTEAGWIIVHQQEDPETGASVRISIPWLTGHAVKGAAQAAALSIAVEWGQSFFKLPPVDHNSKLRIFLGAFGAGMIALAIFWCTPWSGGPHVRLASLTGVGGITVISIAATMDRYAYLYAGGVVLLVGALSWFAWSSYKAGKFEVSNPFNGGAA